MITIHATGEQGTGKTVTLEALAKILKKAGVEGIKHDDANHLLRFQTLTFEAIKKLIKK